MNQNNGNGNSAPAKVSWGTKIGYVGTGVLIGLVIYPFVRKALGKLQPKVDKIFDDLTGKAEHLAEKASDIMARAKDSLYKSDSEKSKHDHPHPHSEH